MGTAKERARVTKEVYQELLDRSQGRCEAIVPMPLGKAWYWRRCNGSRMLEAHHMKARSLGGTGKLDNLIHLCMRCHEKVTDSSNPWFARYRTASHQDEGKFEFQLWNQAANLAASIPGLGELIDRLVKASNGSKQKRIAMVLCKACGLMDLVLKDLMNDRCRGCKDGMLMMQDITEDAKVWRQETGRRRGL